MGEFTLTPDEIVATARSLVEEGGPDALTVRRLASSLFCAPPAIYRRIGDKATLCQMLCDNIIDSAMDAMSEADEADPLARYLTAVGKLLDWCQAHPNLTVLFLQESTSRPMQTPPPLVAYITQMRPAIARWGHQAGSRAQQVEPDVAINMALGAIARIAALHPPATMEFRDGVANVFRLALVDSGVTPGIGAGETPNVDLNDSREDRRAMSNGTTDTLETIEARPAGHP